MLESLVRHGGMFFNSFFNIFVSFSLLYYYIIKQARISFTFFHHIKIWRKVNKRKLVHVNIMAAILIC